MADTKQCPYCAEEIHIDAIKCKHCGEFLDDEADQADESSGEGTTVYDKVTVVVVLLLVVASVWIWRAADTAVPAAPEPRIGLAHITGCEDGDLLVPRVNLFRTPATPPVVGTLSGGGREDRGRGCQGSVVVIRETVTDSAGREFFRVTSVGGGLPGWVADSFIGNSFDPARCGERFSDSPAALARCRGN